MENPRAPLVLQPNPTVRETGEVLRLLLRGLNASPGLSGNNPTSGKRLPEAACNACKCTSVYSVNMGNQLVDAIKDSKYDAGK